MSTPEAQVHRARHSWSPRTVLRGRWLTVLSFSVFLAVTVALIAVNGLFLSRDLLFLWVLVGLLALSVSDLKRWVRGLIFDWLPFAAWLVLYDLSRFFSEKLGTVPHVSPQIRVDQILFGDPVPTVRLQAALNTAGQVAWFDYVVWAVYMTHYFTTLVIAAILWRFAYPRFREFRRMVLTLATFGFITYVAFPAVPPWMAAKLHHLEPVRRIVNVDVWNQLGVQVANSLVENGSGFFNQVAAVPSLHAAYPVLFLLFFWAGARWYWRIVLVAYPLAMAFTLVYSGEHYVSDILLGWFYAVLAFALNRAWDRWRSTRRAAREPAELASAGTPAPAPAALTAAVERE